MDDGDDLATWEENEVARDNEGGDDEEEHEGDDEADGAVDPWTHPQLAFAMVGTVDIKTVEDIDQHGVTQQFWVTVEGDVEGRFFEDQRAEALACHAALVAEYTAKHAA